MNSPRKGSEEAGGGSGRRSRVRSMSGSGGDGASKGSKSSRHSSNSFSLEAKTSQKSAKRSPSSTDSPSKKGPKKSSSQDGSTGASEARPGPPYEKKKPLTKAERRELQEAQRRAKAEKKASGGKSGEGADSKHSGGGATGEDHSAGSKQKASSLKLTKSASLDKPPPKQVQLFAHLPQYERTRSLPATKLLDFTAGAIPACILKLGLQNFEGIICGSNARCIALLAAFKKVIQAYTTPPEKELRRDLDATIKPYITFLSKCRPLSVSMGNAIKHLKLKISSIPPDVSEAEAKRTLCEVIDDYLKHKIYLADKAISEHCQSIIKDGDVILVHAYSSVVQKSLIDAHEANKQFRVIVVDSRPKLEGRHCLRELVSRGIKCSYIFINAVTYIMKEVSKVLVGAHGLLVNGYVMSRVGTSLIALVAKSFNVPFLVCCETYKFCDKVTTDSFVINELGDPNDLVPISRRQGNYLTEWQSIESLKILNLVYDVTSSDLITMVITQVGLIPCTSVPVVLRISRDLEQMQIT